MTDPTLICHDHRTLYDVLFAALGLGSYLARTIWRVVRERNCSRELLRREQQRNIERQNEQLKILATAFASGEPPTLDDLLSHAERDWSLRSSKTPRA
jgi:hypothetical protein